MKMTDVSGVVLAGGRNKRMGANKAEMKLGDQTLLEIQVQKLKNLGIDDIMVSGYQSDLEGTRTVEDIYTGNGPLGGVHACLKAYRQGNFYGAAHGLDELAFTRIAFDGKTVTAATDKPSRLEVITARGVVKEEKGTEISWTIEKTAPWQGAPVHVFARVKAYATDGSGEVLFSQPFMLVSR